MTAKKGSADGAFCYENWRLHDQGAAPGDTLEYPLFTDVSLTGELAEGLGPYQILNALAEPKHRPELPAAFVRITYHTSGKYESMDSTRATRHHGGHMQDEIAALLALSIGAKLKAAGATRWFREGKDPRGRPWTFQHHRAETPILVRSQYGSLLPGLLGERRLDSASLLRSFIELSPDQSIVVVRAARLYQDGTWLADQAPELSWLLLVSAIEVAAGFWRAQTEMPVDRLRASLPQVERILSEAACISVLDPLANLLAPYLGSTRKFIDFVLEFLPPAPEVRPSRYARHSWESEDIKRSLAQIYDYRSKALHAGNPFPTPMCMPPAVVGAGPEEKPPGLASGFMGSVWRAKDTPMLLHTFEYIVRGTLHNWYRSLLPKIRSH